MELPALKTMTLVFVGFIGGVAVSNFPTVNANVESFQSVLTQKEFSVSINEIKQKIVFAESFTETYKKSFKLSDGTTREIELTPMFHENKQVVELKDTGNRTYMGLGGTTTNGTLMISLDDVDQNKKQLKEQGWDFN